MKNILTFFALIFAFAANAQVTFDTTYIRQTGALFYNITRVEYANGNYSESAQLIGDTAAVYTQSRSRIEQRGRDMGIEVAATATFGREFTNIRTQAAQIATLTGKNPVDDLRTDSTTRAHYTLQTWVIRGDTSQNISFNYTASGLLRYRINNGTNRNAQVIGTSVIRLLGYPTASQNTDFFLTRPNRYLTQDGKRRIVLSNQANRN